MKMRFASEKNDFFSSQIVCCNAWCHSSKVFAFWFKTSKFYSVSQFMKMRFASEKYDFFSCQIVCWNAWCDSSKVFAFWFKTSKF
jgi:hypothetical protein